ncbi:DMT family transporter [Flavisolibacter ginsenosidimutans]|uniref:DMT family transporter n=1 Tax=Flavisolibacter ginsenosidimutans TaxID=661481 RepID=A0A5B8UMQ2_9BACT|nr:DMT family transporter [Flavisolibacter ginsenosidimutans]QEC57858.1 DMT family transporter [Flavisolibacter ginsenosidimutans]
MKNGKALSWMLFVLLALIWGSSFVLMKKSAEQLSGWQIGAVRILSASLIFLPAAVFHVRQLPRTKIPLVLLTGFFGNLAPAFLFGIAIQRNGEESSLAGILNSLTPLFVIVIGILFFRANVQRKKLAGVLVGFIGLFILSASKGPLTLNGIGFTLLILLATVFYGLNVNIVGTYLKGLNPVKMSTVSIGFLCLPTTLILWLNPVSLHTPGMRTSIAAAVTLGIMGSAVATVLFYTLIKKAGGLFASLVTYAVPVVAIGWGLLYHEAIGLVQIGCLGIILSGVWLANE